MREELDINRMGIIEIYNAKLSKQISRFPPYFWDDNTMIILFKYVVENVLQWDEKELKEQLCTEMFYDNQINTILSHYNPLEMAMLAYPNRFMPWEFKRLHVKSGANGEENCRKAIRWLIQDRLKLKVPDEIKYLTKNDFKVNNVLFALKMYPSLYEAIHDVFPEVKRYHMKKLSNNESREEMYLHSIRDYIQEDLKITEDNFDDIYNLTWDDFNKSVISSAVRYFDRNYRLVLIKIYGTKYKPWLMRGGVLRGYFNEKENRKFAFEWLVKEKLDMAKEDYHTLTNQILTQYNLNALARYYNYNIDNMLSDLESINTRS